MANQTPVLEIPWAETSDSPNIETATRPISERVEEILLPAGLAAGQTFQWNGAAFVPADLKRRETHTWAVGGEIKVAVGDTDFIPPMFASKTAGETLTLKKLRGRINSGTSVTLKVQKNGSDVAGYTGLVVETTAADEGSTDVTIADDDVIAIVVTAVSGTPKNLSLTAVFERSAA